MNRTDQTEIGFAQANHPPESHAAAEGKRPVRINQRSVILEYLTGRGTEGATCDEIEVALGLPHTSVSARLVEMEGRSIHNPMDATIVRTTETRWTRRGRNARLYVALGFKGRTRTFPELRP